MGPRICTLLVTVLGLCAASALADEVTPNDRVETRLRVRAAPTADATTPIVAFLEPGETAELLDDVPYWWQIRTSGGIEGFVSKGYSRVIPEVGPASILRLGAWNIKKLGHNNGKDYSLVADIIDDRFDVLAVVEVMQRQGGHPGYDALLEALGGGWAGLVTGAPRPDTTSGSAEFYAVLYRTNRAAPCVGWTALVYHEDNDGSGSGTGVDAFSREPAFGCFVAGAFDFLLAPYHATWSDGDIDDISSEVAGLDAVLASMAAARPSEADLIILGDFNLVPSDLEATIGREIPTVGTGSTLNGSGERTENLYDHLLVNDSDATSEQIGSAEVIDVRFEAASNEIFFDTVSDHLPIIARFNVAGPDDD